MQRLNCALMTYAWGKPGETSKAALCKKSQDTSFQIDSSQTYAELWMGTHKNGPSKIVHDCDVENTHESYLSDTCELPFLFKVLSARQALSIQAHPNKQLARELHTRDPKNYPDANHKPEMLIAITQFEGLCGFRPSHEIVTHLSNIPQLRQMCGESNAQEFMDKPNEENLKKCFQELMNKNENFIRIQVDSLTNDITSNRIKINDKSLNDLFLSLNEQYTNDVGLFSIYILNRFVLRPFESVYLRANVPHAYIYGDAIECMACSDNVVRAGLTPKYKDVETLVSMLDYSMRTIDSNKIYENHMLNGVYEYKPSDCDDFCVHRIETQSCDLIALRSPSILIVITCENSSASALVKTSGKTIDLKEGCVYFIHANEHISIHSPTKLLAYRAFSNL